MAAVNWYGGLGAFNMDTFSLSNLPTAPIDTAVVSLLVFQPSPHLQVAFEGLNFTYSGTQVVGGTMTRIKAYDPDARAGTPPHYDINLVTNGDPLPSAAQFAGMVAAGDTPGALAMILQGADFITSLSTADLLRGYGGNDFIEAGQGADTVFGGAGNDTIGGNVQNLGPLLDQPDGSNYLRGDDGDDNIAGGSAFDDINGNQGADVCFGYGGSDWVVGGKDDDALYGDEKPSGAFGPGSTFTAPVGDDIVYGNLGNDTCDGGGGNDLIRGGQQDDVLMGRAGDDWLSGDRDNDTITGGAGADTFHSFGDAGMDRVTDFNRAEGDRILLDPGTTYTVAQVGADTVISMTGGAQMVLVGVSMSSLTGAWITVG